MAETLNQNLPFPFRAWYADDVILKSDSTDWMDLPATGFQIAVIYYVTEGKGYRRRIMSGNDCYYCSPEAPDGIGHKLGAAPLDAVAGSEKLGSTISDEDFERMLDEAMKSTWP